MGRFCCLNDPNLVCKQVLFVKQRDCYIATFSHMKGTSTRNVLQRPSQQKKKPRKKCEFSLILHFKCFILRHFNDVDFYHLKANFYHFKSSRQFTALFKDRFGKLINDPQNVGIFNMDITKLAIIIWHAQLFLQHIVLI